MEEDEVLSLMSHIGAHTSSNDAVPRGLVHYIELRFDYLGDVVEDFFLLEGVLAAVDGVLLHSLGHVSKFDDCHFGLFLWHFLQLL